MGLTLWASSREALPAVPECGSRQSVARVSFRATGRLLQPCGSVLGLEDVRKGNSTSFWHASLSAMISALVSFPVISDLMVANHIPWWPGAQPLGSVLKPRSGRSFEPMPEQAERAEGAWRNRLKCFVHRRLRCGQPPCIGPFGRRRHPHANPDMIRQAQAHRKA